MLQNNRNGLSFYHLVLELGGSCRYMGRVSHVRIENQAHEDGRTSDGRPHTVIFRDTEALRVLDGKVTLDDDDCQFMLDMGKGKRYHFKKLTP